MLPHTGHTAHTHTVYLDYNLASFHNLRAFQRVISECTTYLKNSFMKHLNQQQVGLVRSPGEGLLICGVGEYASGCGRTSLAHHLCQSLISHPTLVHCVEVSGTELRSTCSVSTVCTVCTVCIVCTVSTVCTVCTVCIVCTVCTMCTVCTACTVCTVCTVCSVCTV